MAPLSYRQAAEILLRLRGHENEFVLIGGQALNFWAERSNTSKAAGIETCGLDETLNALAALPPDENVLMFHFSSQRRTFSLFVSESRRNIIGCIRVNRRDAQPGS